MLLFIFSNCTIMLPATIGGISTALILGVLFILTIFKKNPIYMIPGAKKIKSGLMLVILGVGFVMAGGISAVSVGNLTGSAMGFTAEWNAKPYFSGTSVDYRVTDTHQRISATNGNYDGSQTFQGNFTIQRLPGVSAAQNIMVEVVAETFRDELVSADQTYYSVVSIDSSNKPECYIAEGTGATASSTQQSAMINLAESEASQMVSIHCLDLAELDELNTFSERGVWVKLNGNEALYLGVMKTG